MPVDVSGAEGVDAGAATPFVAVLPDAVYSLSYPDPIPVGLPVEVFVHRFFHEAVIAYANDAYAALVGASCPAEVIGQRLSARVPFSEVQARIVQQFYEQGLALQYDTMTVNGITFSITQRGLVHDGHLHTVWGLASQLSEAQTVWAKRIGALEAQLTTMGQELHDGLGQALTGLRMIAEVLLARPGLTDVRPLVEQMVRLAERAQADARALGHTLAGAGPTGFDLPHALGRLAEETTAAGIPCRVLLDDPLPSLPPSVEMQLYRIAQESVTNALRHAHARTVTIAYGRHPGDPGAATLSVEDDGQGLCVQAWTMGMGLSSMHARAAALGGQLAVTPGVNGQGTRVCCVVSDLRPA